MMQKKLGIVNYERYIRVLAVAFLERSEWFSYAENLYIMIL